MHAADHARHPFLDGFSNKHLQLLAACAMPVEFAPGEEFYHEGEEANRFYLIEKGEAALELSGGNHAPIRVLTIGPGATVGWSWMIHPYHSHLSARALTPIKALFFYGARLREECDEDPELGYELMKRVAAVAVTRLESAIHIISTLQAG